ncbi:hypothetical protein QJS10_CPB11g01465 [Acorus calamus]|uniref:Uncharacterized protein n=1 Tax=Acorus calamus TaxID=4465 RepID=A0AAV9DRZ0_ACOCL|nr:hypothetical protein QJS10_CPB11g01465 [Acorus calamus]
MQNSKSTSSLHDHPYLLAVLLVLLLAEAVTAKRTCNGTVAECDDVNDELLMESDTARRLLQSNTQSYGALQRPPPCAGSRGGAYENNCFSQIF